VTTKRQRYNELVAKRKTCCECIGLSNPAESQLRQFDSDQIGPWSRLHGDLNAQLMIVGQDWGGVTFPTRQGILLMHTRCDCRKFLGMMRMEFAQIPDENVVQLPVEAL
jgi:hypothetical protein